MTPTERFFPAIKSGLTRVLEPEGFRWLRTFFSRTQGDLIAYIVPEIIPRANPGCLDIRLILSVLSPHMLSVIHPTYPMSRDHGQIDTEISRFRDPRDRRMWSLCGEADCEPAVAEMNALLTEHALPFLRTLQSTSDLVAALRANTSLAVARPHITLERLDQYERSTK